MGQDGLFRLRGAQSSTSSSNPSHAEQVQLKEWHQTNALIEAALYSLPNTSPHDPDVLGCVIALCRSAPTIHTGIRCLIDLLPAVHTVDREVILIEGRETAEFAWIEYGNGSDSIRAHTLAAALHLKLLQAIAGPTFQPVWVSFSSALPPAEIPDIESMLNSPVRSGAQRNAIAFAAELLEKPVPSANHLLYRLLGTYLERLKSEHHESTATKVDSYIRGALGTGACSIERCAEASGMSVRTLQSRLSLEGIKFSELVEKQREALARNYLADRRLTLDDIACRLGYREQTSFGRAFKRWTKMTPQQFRTNC